MISHFQRRLLCFNLALAFLMQATIEAATTPPIKVVINMKKPYVSPNGADASTAPVMLTYANAGAGTVSADLTTKFCLLFKTIFSLSGSDLASSYVDASCTLDAIGTQASDATKATLTGSIYFNSGEASNRLTATSFLQYMVAGEALGWGPITAAPTAPLPIPLAFLYIGVQNAANALNPAGTDIAVTVTGASVSSLSGAKSGANQYSTNAMLIAGASLIPAGLYRLLSQQC